MPRLVTLGGLSLVAGQELVAGPAARGRSLALLALLARAEEAGTTRERLAALLWPESDETRARHSLGQALYTLRRAFGPDWLLAGGNSIALNRGVVECDVLDFSTALEADDLPAAIEVYGGPFLNGFHLSGAAGFERWVDDERAGLHRKYTTALESLAHRSADAGDHAAAVRYWRRLAAAEPLSARVALGLMRALDRAGDRTGALQAAAVHETLVRDELDTPADPTIHEYVAALRQALPPRTDPSLTARLPLPDTVDAVEPGVPAAMATGVHARDTGAGRVPARPQSARSRRAGWWLGLATVVVMAAILVRFASDAVAPPPVVAGPERTRLRVEPLTDETGNRAHDVVGRIAADYIVDGLIRTGFVQVVEGRIGDRPDGIVSGRIYPAGDSIVFAVRIERPDDGTVRQTVLVSIDREADPADAMEPLRQRVLGAIGTLWDPRLASFSGATLRPPTFDAYREFAAGIEAFSFPRDLTTAANRFRRAADLDPEFIMPRLWLAWTYSGANEPALADSVARSLEPYRDAMSPLERAWHDRITAALAGDNEASYRAAVRMTGLAERPGWVIALASTALDTNRPGVAVSTLLDAGMDNLGIETAFPWFLLTAAYHALGDYQAELSATDDAIARIGLAWGYLGPGVPGLAALGRVEELKDRVRALAPVELEDGLSGGSTALATAAMELRAHGHAAEAAALFAELDSTQRSPGREEARRDRVDVLYEMGRWNEAAGLHVLEPRTQRNEVAWTGMTGLLAARLEQPAVARQALDDLEAIDDRFLFGEQTFMRARIEAVLGNHDRSIELLRQAFAEGLYSSGWYRLHVLRDFDPLRGLAAFQELVRPRP